MKKIVYSLGFALALLGNASCDTNDYNDKEKQDTTIEEADAEHVDKIGRDSSNMIIDTIHK